MTEGQVTPLQFSAAKCGNDKLRRRGGTTAQNNKRIQGGECQGNKSSLVPITMRGNNDITFSSCSSNSGTEKEFIFNELFEFLIQYVFKTLQNIFEFVKS